MWEIFNTSDGFVRIRNVDSRKSLEVRDGSNSNGANVEQRSFGGETHQEWEILPTSDGYFRIRSRDSRKTIAVDGASRSTGANIEIDAWNGDDRFQWKFNAFGQTEVVEEPSNEEIIEEVINEVIENNEEEETIEEIVEEVMEEEAIEEIVEEIIEEEEVVETVAEEMVEEMVEEIIEEMVQETTETITSGDFGLNPNLEPWENFDLSDWSLDSPAQRPSDRCRAVRINEDEYDEIPGSPTRPYFFTHTDGGMRFVSPVGGATTNDNCNSGFPRSELREMLRAGNTDISTTGPNGNNWALGYQPSNSSLGGRNGRLAATLRINPVSYTHLTLPTIYSV